MRCDYLVPLMFGWNIPVDDDCGECLLKKGHPKEHLAKTSWGYYLWLFQENFCEADGETCDCDYVECYAYEQIPDAEAKRILAKYGAGTE